MCASGNNNSQLSIFNFKPHSKPKLRKINYKNNILVTSDYIGDNIAVLEKSNNKINLYTAEGTLKSSSNGNFDFNCIVLYGNNYIFAGENHGKILVYDLKNNSTRKSFETNYKIPIDLIDVSIDNKLLFICYTDGKVSKFEIKTSQFDNLTWINEKINCINASPWDADKLLVGSVNGIVSLYDVNCRSRIFSSHSHRGILNCVSCSYYNDKIAISGGEDQQAILHGINEIKPLKTYKTTSPVTSCSMSDGVLFAFGESNGDVSIFDIRKLDKLVYSHKFQERIRFLQFTYKSRRKGDSVEYLGDHFDDNELNYGNGSFESCFSDVDYYSVNYNNNSHDHQQRQIPDDSFNISQYNQAKSTSLLPISKESKLSNENKVRKQVQFESANSNDNESLDWIGSDSTTNPGSNVIIDCNSIQSREIDSELLRKIIHEELNMQLLAFEDRLSTDILMKFIDQLFITENNIVQSLMPVVVETRELLKENKSLLEKLDRQNFFWNKL